MAAQERAKSAQMKQASAALAPVSAPAPAPAPSMKFETEKMMNALNGLSAGVDANGKKGYQQQKEEELPTISMRPSSSAMGMGMGMGATMGMAPAVKVAAPAPAPAAPPSFNVFEKQMQQMNMNQTQQSAPSAMPMAMAPPMPMAPPMMAMAPPAFDAIAPQIFQQQQPPSAPAFMAPPAVAVPPPQLSAADTDLLGDFGGIMPMAPPISASAPGSSAPTFEEVMAQQMMPETNTNTKNDTDDYNFELDENGMQMSPEDRRQMIDEQRRIMEQIEKKARDNKASEMALKADAFANRMAGAGVGNAGASVMAPPATVDGFSSSEVEEQRRILAQIEAENGGSRQTMSIEDVVQMQEDRRMAELLQAEENAAAGEDGASDYPANRSTQQQDSSIWGAFNAALVQSGMVAPSQPDDTRTRQSVTRPPGSSSRTMLHSAVTGTGDEYGNGGSERLGLLGGEDGRPAARVAQSAPLFSCIVDSVSNTAAAVGSTLMGEDDDDEVNGVDTTSFLAVPNTGRDKEGGGNYFAIPPNE